ncbi:hypothetical protein [Fusobacterium polymorphum]|jgi:hypothetical protein|uniref:hypothetical protein n=1 Tax=Fusobacterium nucleatum subsp. polymorphum TaxID=76857 RepID=UPI0020559466|nr:MAG TPA: hypothetical protein [Caudoviricetes sp.]DAY32392.1 MAG TPA: hypothetical protein [Caudoviricetes sp.]
MAFLDKIAKQERTGAGIAGVNVDTGIVNMISPKNFDGTPIKAIGTMSTYQLEVLDTIEKFAKDVDKARTENAKIKLGLDLENARIDLEEKWAGVHDKYTNDDTWNSYLEDKKKLLSEQSKMISSMKYMSMEEKKLAIEKNDIAYREDYAKNLGIRTDAVAKREADNARGNLEQIVTITSNLGIHDDKKAQENYKTMVNQINVLKEFAGLSNEQALVMYGNYVTKAEMGRQENYLEQVVMNEDLTFEQREAKLNELKKVMDNKDLMRAYAKEMTDLFTTDNKEEAEEYLYTKLTDESSKVINRMSNQFKRVKKERQEVERARARAAAAEARARKRAEKERMQMLQANFNIAYNSGNYTTMENAITAKTSKGVRYDDRVLGEINALESGNINNSRIYHITGKSVKEINANNEYIKGYVPETVLDNMRVDVANSIRDGKSESQAIIDVASTYSGDNPEMTQLVVNSLTQDGGYTKSIDVGIQAKKGDVIAKAKLGAIGSIEKTRALTPQLDGAQIEEYASTDEAKIMINKLVEKGADKYTAKKSVAEYNAGLRIQEYKTRTGNETDKDILYTGDINWKDKNNANKKMKSMVNQDTAVEAFADSITPRKRMKSTSLKGDLKL